VLGRSPEDAKKSEEIIVLNLKNLDKNIFSSNPSKFYRFENHSAFLWFRELLELIDVFAQPDPFAD
jgi:hypothetical protein